PPAMEALDVKFFEEPNAYADQQGVRNAHFERTVLSERREPGEQGKNRDRQQDRDEPSADRDREWDKVECHRAAAVDDLKGAGASPQSSFLSQLVVGLAVELAQRSLSSSCVSRQA